MSDELLRREIELAIIRKADQWLAMQYGLRPLEADLDRIRALPARASRLRMEVE